MDESLGLLGVDGRRHSSKCIRRRQRIIIHSDAAASWLRLDTNRHVNERLFCAPSQQDVSGRSHLGRVLT